MHGKRLAAPVLRNQFDIAKNKASTNSPDLSDAIKEFWFYYLRAKAADETSDERGEQAASDLLGPIASRPHNATIFVAAK